jgi:hypothetical protein
MHQYLYEYCSGDVPTFVRPSDGKARIRISNEYLYNVLQCTVARLYSSHLAILVAVRRFPCMDIVNYGLLRRDTYVRMQHFVRRYIFVTSRRFLGDMRRFWRNLCNVFPLLFMVLLVSIFVMTCMRAVPKMWNASLCLGLRYVGGFSSLFFSLCLVVSTSFSCKELS